MMSKKQALYEQVAKSIIEKLEAGVSPFEKPWENSEGVSFGLPLNPTTGKNYRGMNSLWLYFQGHNDPRWMTFKQAQSKGWQVRKGEKATTINFVKHADLRIVKDEKGKPVLDDKGEPKKILHHYDSPIITSAWVFNASQIDGIPSLEQILAEKQKDQKWTNLERAEMLIQDTKATIRHGGNDAYYSPALDHIQMPDKNQFKTASGYYGTLLHEVAHWTGNEKRLDRDMTGRFGDEDYAKEELIAEIASFMIRGEIGGLERELDKTATYVNNWISVLKNEPFEVFRAASSAQKVLDYVLDFENKRELKIEENAKKEYPTNTLGPFVKEEEIKYKEQTYRILEVKEKGGLDVEILESGSKFKVKPKDGIYNSLLNAKRHQLTIGFDKQIDLTKDIENENKNSKNFKR